MTREMGLDEGNCGIKVLRENGVVQFPLESARPLDSICWELS